jgi:ketosteroid isomerase-like protein
MPAKIVQEFHQLFPEYIRNGDIDAALELYEPGAAFANRQGEVRVGLEALRQELAPFAAMKANFKFNLRKIVQAGDIALVRNEWKTTSSNQEMSGYAVEVFRRQVDATWRLVIGDPFTVPSQAGS